MARWGDHRDEGDELFEVDLQVSVLVEVCKELIQSVVLVDFLFGRKKKWKWNVCRSRLKVYSNDGDWFILVSIATFSSDFIIILDQTSRDHQCVNIYDNPSNSCHDISVKITLINGLTYYWNPWTIRAVVSEHLIHSNTNLADCCYDLHVLLVITNIMLP